MVKIKNVKVENFRGIRSGELTDLAPLTILTGPNASGKSTILDALRIGAAPRVGDAVRQVLAQRTCVQGNKHKWLVHQPEARLARISLDDRKTTLIPVQRHLGIKQELRDEKYHVDIERDAKSESYSVTGEGRDRLTELVSEVEFIAPSVPISLHYPYSQTFRQGRKQRVLELLRTIVSQVEDVSVLVEDDDKPALYIEHSGGAVPTALYGDGVHAFLQVVLQAEATDNDGLLLVDTPEAHQDETAQAATAKVLLGCARRGVQVVLATQSSAFIQHFSGYADLASIFYLPSAKDFRASPRR